MADYSAALRKNNSEENHRREHGQKMTSDKCDLIKQV